jgi:hypothetical protein
VDYGDIFFCLFQDIALCWPHGILCLSVLILLYYLASISDNKP